MEGILLTNYSESLLQMERWDAAEESLAEALRIARGGDDPARAGEALKFLGVLKRERGQAAAASQSFEDALLIARMGSNPLLVAEVLRERAELRRCEGDQAGALSDLREALPEFEALDATLDADDTRTQLAALIDEIESEDSE